MDRVLGPRWVLPAYWMIFLGATIIFHPTSKLDGNSALFIVVSCFMFLFGALIATLKSQNGRNSLGAFRIVKAQGDGAGPMLRSSVIRWASIVGSACNMGAALLALRNSPVSLADIITLQGLAESTNSLAVERYSGGPGDGVIVFLLLGIGYVAALVAPFIRATNSSRHIGITLLPAGTSLAYAAVTSARLGFLVAAALTAGGVIACSVMRNKIAPRVKLKTILSVALVGIILGVLFTGIGVLRTGRLDSEVLQATVDKQASYTVGAVGAFSSWYTEYGTGVGEDLGYGTATIAGMEYVTGQERAATRAYGEFAVIDDSGRTSNVYTVFRGLILDFGIDGTMVFLSIVGFVFGRLYLAAVNGSIAAGALLGYGYASIFLSGWMAMTTFTNLLAVAVAAPVVLCIARFRGSQSTKETDFPLPLGNLR